METPLVSVILAPHNARDFIVPCLESLCRQDYGNIQVLFVDNASTDGSAEFIEHTFPWVTVIRSATNLAYAGGNNLGAQHADGELLLFLNHDTEVCPGFLTELVDVMKNNPDVAICQSKILRAAEPHTVDSIGAYITRTGVWIHPGQGGRDEWDGPLPRDVLGACGACLMVRREVFERLGGFDEDFVIYFEDADLSWRARALGSRVIVVPRSVIYHWGGATTSKLPSPFTVYHSFKNRLCLLIKMLAWKDLVTILPVHIAFCVGGAVAYFAGLKPHNAAAVVRGVAWNARALRRTLRKRTEVWSLAGGRARECYREFVLSLPIGYFIRTSLGYLKKW